MLEDKRLYYQGQDQSTFQKLQQLHLSPFLSFLNPVYYQLPFRKTEDVQVTPMGGILILRELGWVFPKGQRLIVSTLFLLVCYSDHFFFFFFAFSTGVAWKVLLESTNVLFVSKFSTNTNPSVFMRKSDVCSSAPLFYPFL